MKHDGGGGGGVVARRLIGSLASIGAGLLLLHQLKGEFRGKLSEAVFVTSLALVPVVAGGLIWIRRIEAQLLARGAWWSMLLSSALVSLGVNGATTHVPCYVAVPAAAALISSGGSGLEVESGRFRPVAFRGTLTLALVLAMADAGALLWFGLGNAMFGKHASVLLMAVPMVVSVIGLLRLRTWGLLLGMVSNVLVAVLSLARVLDLPNPLRLLFAATATLQLLVPLPMLITIVRGRVPGPDRWRTAKLAVSTATIAAVASLSVYASFVHPGRLLHF